MSKEYLQNRILLLRDDLEGIKNLPKRSRTLRHDFEATILEGRIHELKYLLLTFDDNMTAQNIIEQ